MYPIIKIKWIFCNKVHSCLVFPLEYNEEWFNESFQLDFEFIELKLVPKIKNLSDISSSKTSCVVWFSRKWKSDFVYNNIQKIQNNSNVQRFIEIHCRSIGSIQYSKIVWKLIFHQIHYCFFTISCNKSVHSVYDAR